MRTLDKRCSLKEAQSQIFDFRPSAPRQNGDHRVFIAQTQHLPGRLAVGLHWNHGGQWMADIGRCNSVSGQQCRLEWKYAQHMVHTALDFFNPVSSPGPNRRADKLDRLDPFCLKCSLQVEVKVGRVDADEQVGTLTRRGQKPLFELLANAGDFPVMAQHFDIAAHSEFVAWPPCIKTQAGHVRTTNSAGFQTRPARGQPFQQQTGQQITRNFASHHRDVWQPMPEPRKRNLSRWHHPHRPLPDNAALRRSLL